MDKFTQKTSKIEIRKYDDKTKNDIYNIIKENISVNIKNNGYVNNSSVSLDGLEELTDIFYNYIQKEKVKQEILTLEKMKLNTAIGRPFNVKNINEHIENLKEQLKS